MQFLLSISGTPVSTEKTGEIGASLMGAEASSIIKHSFTSVIRPPLDNDRVVYIRCLLSL